MSIILCGLPCCGKTTLGKIISKIIGINFIDTDDSIQNSYKTKTGKTCLCKEIYSSVGDITFRELEHLEIQKLYNIAPSIVSLGGGCIINSENILLLKQIGRIYFIDTPHNVIWKRIKSRGLPTFLSTTSPEESFYKLAMRRHSIYKNNSDVTIKTSSNDQHVIISSIIKEWKQYYGK